MNKKDNLHMEELNNPNVQRRYIDKDYSKNNSKIKPNIYSCTVIFIFRN